VADDWSRYWRAPDAPLEAMYAHFERHVYHRHSHDAYSFGVTEDGAQAFSCRGAGHTSVTGMVMAFNPDDPHDGQAADALGFTYRIIHIGPGLVASVLADITGRPAGLPLFTKPVHIDLVLARNLTALHRALAADQRRSAAPEKPAPAIPVEIGGRTRMVECAQVCWVEAVGDYVRLHLTDGSAHLTRMPISHVEEKWSAYGFVRIHRGHLVPVRAITEFAMVGGNHTVTVFGQVLPVSRRHARDVRERFLRASDGR